MKHALYNYQFLASFVLEYYYYAEFGINMFVDPVYVNKDSEVEMFKFWWLFWPCFVVCLIFYSFGAISIKLIKEGCFG